MSQYHDILTCVFWNQTTKIINWFLWQLNLVVIAQGRRKLPRGGVADGLEQNDRHYGKKFSLSFSVIKVGSRGTFVL